MGNRKKLRIRGRRNNSLRQKRTEIPRRGLIDIAGRLFEPDNRPFMPPTPDEMFAAGLTPEEQAKMPRLKMPASNESVIKVVDARHKGIRVGDAFIHEDGQISLVFDEDAPQWALDEIRGEAQIIGYDLESGTPDGTP